MQAEKGSEHSARQTHLFASAFWKRAFSLVFRYGNHKWHVLRFTTFAMKKAHVALHCIFSNKCFSLALTTAHKQPKLKPKPKDTVMIIICAWLFVCLLAYAKHLARLLSLALQLTMCWIFLCVVSYYRNLNAFIRL